MVRIAAFLALILPAGSTASTQQNRFDPRLLRRGVDSMSISLVRDGAPTIVGELWDQLDDITVRGAPALRRVYRTINQAFGPHLETTMVRLPDLTLLSRRTYSQATSDSVAAYGDSLRGWRDRGQGARRPISRPAPRLIDGSLFDVLVRGAQLSPSYTVGIQAYLSTQDSVATLNAHVTGSDRIVERDGSAADTWRVEIDFAGLSSTLWIDRKTRALVRQIIRLTPSISMLMER
jgi:hypothetical protein